MVTEHSWAPPGSANGGFILQRRGGGSESTLGRWGSSRGGEQSRARQPAGQCLHPAPHWTVRDSLAFAIGSFCKEEVALCLLPIDSISELIECGAQAGVRKPPGHWAPGCVTGSGRSLASTSHPKAGPTEMGPRLPLLSPETTATKSHPHPSLGRAHPGSPHGPGREGRAGVLAAPRIPPQCCVPSCLWGGPESPEDLLSPSSRGAAAAASTCPPGGLSASAAPAPPVLLPLV